MFRSIAFSLITLGFATLAPATLEPTEAFTLSPMRMADLKATPFLHKSVTGTFKDAGPTAMDVFKTVHDKNIAPAGAMVFVFKDMKPDPAAKVSMEIGFPVAEGTKAPEGYEVTELESQHSATTVFTGNIKDIGQAIGKFIGQVKHSGNEMAGPIRERVLYWEDEGSDNNIILIEIPLQSL